jgi:hypothetical protein
MTAQNGLKGADSGGASDSVPQTRRVFRSKYGYTVEYVGHGLYVLRGRTSEGVVRPLWMLVDLISVVYGDEEARELARVMSQ